MCDYSMSSDALSRRAVGRFRVDIRLCQGRKGLPHVAYEDMTIAETKAEPKENLQIKIGGMQCSFCVKSIRKAYRRMKRVRGQRQPLL